MSLKSCIIDLFVNDILQALLASEHCDDDKAAQLAQDIFQVLQKRWGGSQVWIPVASTETRRQQIRDAFTGANHAEVCNRFGISLRTLYRAVRG